MNNFIETILKHAHLTRDMKITLLSYAEKLTEIERRIICVTLNKYDKKASSELKILFKEKIKAIHKNIHSLILKKRKISVANKKSAMKILKEFEIKNNTSLVKLLKQYYKNLTR